VSPDRVQYTGCFFAFACLPVGASRFQSLPGDVPMRKLLLSFTVLLFMAGLVVAAEVTLIKFDREKKEVTVKEGEDEKTYKITDKTKFSAVDKDGNAKELAYDDAVKGLGNPKAEGKLKFNVTVKDGEIVEAKMRARKKN
jgi:hypothetical protein